MSDNLRVGQCTLQPTQADSTGGFLSINGERYYRIRHVDQMPPFFMSLVSGSDHWLFIASNGGVSAGRIDAESALFPYETEDKLIAHPDSAGSTTLIKVARNGHIHLWEPYNDRYEGLYRRERHLYKNVLGNSLIFEEINHDLHLRWRATWRTSDRFGIVREDELQNQGESCRIELLDGWRNLLPYGTTLALQTSFSNLLNAYKRNELEPLSGLGIFALSATLTDLAEPSESLMATVAWQVGLQPTHHLLSTQQLDAFRRGEPLHSEHDLRGKAGAYLVAAEIALQPAQTQRWRFVADVNQDAADVVALTELLGSNDESLIATIDADIAGTSATLRRYIAMADGLQRSHHEMVSAHHSANVMFNIMRGGIFAEGYTIRRPDFIDFVERRNRPLRARHAAWIDALPDRLSVTELHRRAETNGDCGIIRLCDEYLPLTFSRRHGDPSRPWNQFAIKVKWPDGSPRLDYQGNWRDIFQNWEPLLYAYPAYIDDVIAKFLNATTADGYNPYRVTREGIEWEVPEPDNPWANIGYWSDHQIIYLQKLLELAEQFQPGRQQPLWQQPRFSYADVPYRLRPYDDMLDNWYDTIDFDWAREEVIAQRVAAIGSDGRLLPSAEGDILHVTMMEKLLVLLLAKLSNLVPEGGIWMNTQRPEWNDANNALVGKGLSVVTAAYLRRFVLFWQARLAESDATDFTVNQSLATLFHAVTTLFDRFQGHLTSGFDDPTRRAMMDALGAAATRYRSAIYDDGPAATQQTLSSDQINRLLTMAGRYLDQTLRANRRADKLYHAYNVLHLSEEGAAVEHLYLMLEGQVALLSSGMLSADESLALLRALRDSALYRADQHSYMLYPNRRLPGFLAKNHIPTERLADSSLVGALMAADDSRLLVQDRAGAYHFNGRFRNQKDVERTLDILADEPRYAAMVATERDAILALFEEIFDHRTFTGRSGTFFAYEGLGSIYWHMVSKLLLAVQETYFAAVAEAGADSAVATALRAAYFDIRDGLGYNKGPSQYGAFPTDPYSHSPFGGGASQPGMTGQVKEEILTRWGELGVVVTAGTLCFRPTLLPASEFLDEPALFDYVDVEGNDQSIPLTAGSLAFTFCQTPIIYLLADTPQIDLIDRAGQCTTVDGNQLDATASGHIFDRDGEVQMVRVSVPLGTYHDEQHNGDAG
ncbi:MAG: hypothetical protein H6638_07055 [Ardenticatenales bacterium]|nr:hypothetical protein [Ardenticatenales bacterium]